MVTRVKAYIDAGTCNTVTFSEYSEAECGDSATSYYKEVIYNNKRVVISNNVSAVSHLIISNNSLFFSINFKF